MDVENAGWSVGFVAAVTVAAPGFVVVDDAIVDAAAGFTVAVGICGFEVWVWGVSAFGSWGFGAAGFWAPPCAVTDEALGSVEEAPELIITAV